MKMKYWISLAVILGIVISGGMIARSIALSDGTSASNDVDGTSSPNPVDTSMPQQTEDSGGTVTPEPTGSATAAPQATEEPAQEPTSAPTSKPASDPTAKPTSKPTAKPTVKPTLKPTAKPGPRVFTLAQLKAANGQNGSPAYVAYHGKVYDLAGDPAFVNGVHKYDKRIKAGMDLTDLFDNEAPGSHRANDYFARLKEIGVLSTNASQGAGGSGSSPAPSATPASNMKVFTLAQLQAANGQNGAPAYIVYHGKVYDLAGDPAFTNGVHKYDKRIKAGMDLTNYFDQQAPGSHRTNDYISRLTQVGVMDPSYKGPDPVTGGGEWEEEDD